MRWDVPSGSQVGVAVGGANRHHLSVAIPPGDEGHSGRVSDLILSVLSDVEPLMQAAFDAVGGLPEPGSALDQVNLLEGREVIVDYLAHGEPGVAFDHLLYMIREPPLTIPAEALDRLALAGLAMGVDPSAWASIATLD